MSEHITDIRYIADNYKFISSKKTQMGDDRLFFLDEDNIILYCMGPSRYIRKAKESAESERIMIVEYEGGPYLQVGDNVYDDQIIRDFVFFEDQGIIITGMILETSINSNRDEDRDSGDEI
jgi:hypothetical protein